MDQRSPSSSDVSHPPPASFARSLAQGKRSRPLPRYTRQFLRRLRLKVAEALPENLPLDFSVVICTYNGEQRLPAVLKGLLWQVKRQPIAWEVLVVDNSSTDGTAAVVEAIRAQWPSDVPLRYVCEPRQGASFARQQAIQLARSPLVGFLADDSIPSPLWVDKAYDFGRAHPAAVAYGSRIRALLEGDPPPHFDRIADLLALTDRGAQPFMYDPTDEMLSLGTGLVVRRQAWLEAVPSVSSLGETRGDWAAGADLDWVLSMQRQGQEIWYNPAMRVSQIIPAHRLQRDSLMSLCRGMGLSRHRIRMLRFPAWQRPLVTPRYLASDGCQVLRHLLRHRQAVVTDTVTACEMTLYLYSLMSPFYGVWRQSWGRRPTEADLTPGDSISGLDPAVESGLAVDSAPAPAVDSVPELPLDQSSARRDPPIEPAP